MAKNTKTRIVSRLKTGPDNYFEVVESHGDTSVDFYTHPQRWTHPETGQVYETSLVRVSFNARENTLTLTWSAWRVAD